MPQMDSDMTRADPRTRYIGKGKATLVNTNIILGSSWIEAERFRYERDLKSTSDWMKQKTIMNANMWTPSTVATTQTFVFCSTGDEARMGSAYSVRGLRISICPATITCSSSRPRTVGPSGTPSFGALVTAALCPVLTR